MILQKYNCLLYDSLISSFQISLAVFYHNYIREQTRKQEADSASCFLKGLKKHYRNLRFAEHLIYLRNAQ